MNAHGSAVFEEFHYLCFCKDGFVTAFSFGLEPPVQLQRVILKYLRRQMRVLLVHYIGIKCLFFLLLARAISIRMAFRDQCHKNFKVLSIKEESA